MAPARATTVGGERYQAFEQPHAESFDTAPPAGKLTGMRWSHLALACALTSLAACAPARSARRGPRTGQAPTEAHALAGKASYYADSLAGRSTASGEPYDPRAFTAAHRTLPFGTWVEVRRADGRSALVRVNDRGPFAKGRVIDLSRAAAEALGMVRAGVVEVVLMPR